MTDMTVQLSDGTTGYYPEPGRTDMCFTATVATCLQVPFDQVPDPDLDERVDAGEDPEVVDRDAWLQFAKWLRARGLGMRTHESNRLPWRARRWIGVIRVPGVFQAHTLVMARNKALWDPATNQEHRAWPADRAAEADLCQERRVMIWCADHVNLGYSFYRLKDLPQIVDRDLALYMRYQ